MRAFIVLMAVLVFPGLVHAKSVVLEWEPIEGAAQYDLKITQKGKSILSKSVEKPKWNGSLQPGLYSWQLRAVDRLNNPGDWSEISSLVVLAPAPEPLLPEDGEKFVFYDHGKRTLLRWQEVSGASAYAVEVFRGKDKIHSSLVRNGTELDLGALAPGDYRWNLKTVISGNEEGERKWEGKPSSPREFTIVHAALERPLPVFPKGPIVSQSAKVTFSWKKVEGAEGYELRLVRKLEGQDRAVASDLGVSNPLIVKENTATLDLIAISKLKGKGTIDGQYVWQIRALASLEKGSSMVTGPGAITEFMVDHASYGQGAGFVALSSIFAPFSYQIISPLSGYRGTTQSTALTGRLSAEYWPRARVASGGTPGLAKWGVASGFEMTGITFNNQNYGRLSFELLGKYQIPLTSSRYGWVLSPKAGVEGRQYLSLTPVMGVSPLKVEATTLMALGATLGLDVRKQFSARWSLGTKFSYFRPLSLSGAAGAAISPEASYRNLSFGALCIYWLTPDIGLSGGTFLEKRSISYLPVASAARPQPQAEQVYTDGSYFYGSVIFNFGR